MKKLSVLFLTLFLSISASAADLNLILDSEYARDGDESAQTHIAGIEFYSKKYGSLTIGYGYEQQKAEFFGSINKKSSNGIYLRYQAIKKIGSF